MESKKNLKRTRNKNNTSHIINSKLKRRTNQYELQSSLVLTIVCLLLLCVVSNCEVIQEDLDSGVNLNSNHLYHQSLQYTADSSPGLNDG